MTTSPPLEEPGSNPKAPAPLAGARAARYVLANLVIVTGLALSVLWCDQPEIRYHSYPNHYAAIFGQEGPVDLAVTGGSGAVCAFDPEEVARLMEERLGRPFVALDLAKSWQGSGFKYLLLRDLLSRRKVKHVSIRLRWNGDYVHGRLWKCGTQRDLLESSFTLPAPWWRRLREALDLSVRRVAFHLTISARGDRTKLPAKPVEPSKTTTMATNGPNGMRPVRQKKWFAKFQEGWETRPGRAWVIGDEIDGRNDYYYKKIIDLCRAQGATVNFYEVPQVFCPPLTEEFVQEVEARYGIPVAQLSREELKPLFPRGFADEGHANVFGRRYMSEHLFANPIMEFFEPEPKK